MLQLSMPREQYYMEKHGKSETTQPECKHFEKYIRFTSLIFNMFEFVELESENSLDNPNYVTNAYCTA